MDENTGLLSMYYLLPELSSDVSLVYRSKDVYTKVLVDGEVIYQTSVYESPLYNKSPGNLWNMLNVSTAYSGKHLEIQIKMVYLDVNDLKKVNDNLGHEYGDKLLKSAAKIISESFGAFGKSYRIGGDEFCVLMSGENIEENYDKGLILFKSMIEDKNNSGKY